MFKILMTLCAMVGGQPVCSEYTYKEATFEDKAACEAALPAVDAKYGPELRARMQARFGELGKPLVGFECVERPKGEEEF